VNDVAKPSRNRVDTVGYVAREAEGWTICDASGALLVWTTSPTRIDAIKCRIHMMGATITGHVTDAAVEAWWREQSDPKEDVVAVRLTALLH
jgi:hypothetical protein